MRLVLVALAFAFGSSAADAQFRRSPPFAERGDLALSVEIAGVELQPALGGVGMRYRVADRTVLGASVGLGVDLGDSEDGNAGEAASDRTSFRLTAWTEQHVARRARTVSPFVGAGASVRIEAASSESERTVPDGDGEVVLRQRQDADLLTVGAGLLLGAEVRLARGVTLGGAYILGAEYARRESRSESDGFAGEVPSVSRSEQSSVRFGTGATDIVLSVYF